MLGGLPSLKSHDQLVMLPDETEDKSVKTDGWFKQTSVKLKFAIGIGNTVNVLCSVSAQPRLEERVISVI